MLDDARDYNPARLRERDDAPPRRAQHAREVRKREQRKCVSASLYTVKRDHVMYEVAAEQLLVGSSFLGLNFDKGVLPTELRPRCSWRCHSRFIAVPRMDWASPAKSELGQCGAQRAPKETR
jgi:hypothetical protein